MERRALDRSPQENPFVYIVGYLICQVERSGQLVIAENFTSWGEITQITRDDNQRFVIKSASGHALTLSAKKVAHYGADTDVSGIATLLVCNGYALPVTNKSPVTDKFQRHLAAVFPQITTLTAIPERYAVIDCEFGILFGVQHQGNSVLQQRVSILGEKASVFQLAVLSYAGNRQTAPFFNRYLDHPNFSPTLKLRGLRETGLPLAAYEAQAKPVVVLKAFIHEVLARELPLVFWDQRNDLRLLRQALAVHFNDFSVGERAVLGKPLAIFDGSAYTNLVINRSNHVKRDAQHYLPLNGVAGLLNIFNPQQHNALWDAQTTHSVVHALAKIQDTQPLILTQPKPVTEDTVEESQQRTTAHVLVPSAATFCQLRATGHTYREIAQQFGISTSTVWRTVQQATRV